MQIWLACWWVMLLHPVRYLFFYADRFDRARGFWAGYKETSGKWGWGRYFKFAVLFFFFGVADYDAYLEISTREAYGAYLELGTNN